MWKSTFNPRIVLSQATTRGAPKVGGKAIYAATVYMCKYICRCLLFICTLDCLLFQFMLATCYHGNYDILAFSKRRPFTETGPCFLSSCEWFERRTKGWADLIILFPLILAALKGCCKKKAVLRENLCIFYSRSWSVIFLSLLMPQNILTVRFTIIIPLEP